MVSIDIYGVRVGIRSNEPALLERARPFLPIGWKPIESAGVDRQYFLQVAPQPETQRPVYSLEQGLETLAHSPQLGYVLAMLEYDLELHVAEHTPNFVFVHAGVVGWQGRAIVIPGRSYSGKSSPRPGSATPGRVTTRTSTLCSTRTDGCMPIAGRCVFASRCPTCRSAGLKTSSRPGRRILCQWAWWC